jgi:tRNA-binding protein
MISVDDFEKVEIRVGKIIEVEDYPEARNPSFKLKIDFGAKTGVKKSVGQFPPNYSKDELMNKLVACVVNFPPRQIGPALSEVLTLGFPDENGKAVLISPSKDVPLGGKLF